MSSADGSPAARHAVMADVARLAGVSQQTVSRVVHESPQVRAATRERVLAAMRELDYRPNSMARALVTGRTRTLGILTLDTTLYGPASTLLAVERAAHDAGYFVSIVSVRSLDAPSILHARERLRGQNVDGIVAIIPQDSVAAMAELSAGPPLVLAETGPEGLAPVVEVDQFAGAVMATEHLLALGHRTVFHIAGPSDWPEAHQRAAGWRAALTAAGAEVPDVLAGDWSAASGHRAARRLLERSDVSAVFAANDQMALGVLCACHEMGRRVPQAISVVGFDDVPEAPFLTPALTTVRQDFNEVGRRALRALIALVEADGRPAARHTVAPELVVRASTAPPSERGAR